jgi:hypothetical protein
MTRKPSRLTWMIEPLQHSDAKPFMQNMYESAHWLLEKFQEIVL